jgi:hypothetical protein
LAMPAVLVMAERGGVSGLTCLVVGVGVAILMCLAAGGRLRGVPGRPKRAGKRKAGENKFTKRNVADISSSKAAAAAEEVEVEVVLVLHRPGLAGADMGRGLCSIGMVVAVLRAGMVLKAAVETEAVVGMLARPKTRETLCGKRSVGERLSGRKGGETVAVEGVGMPASFPRWLLLPVLTTLAGAARERAVVTSGAGGRAGGCNSMGVLPKVRVGPTSWLEGVVVAMPTGMGSWIC